MVYTDGSERFRLIEMNGVCEEERSIACSVHWPHGQYEYVMMGFKLESSTFVNRAAIFRDSATLLDEKTIRGSTQAEIEVLSHQAV